MFSTIDSGAVCGLQAYLVRVEVDLAGGLPSFQMVGSLGSEVRESRERVCVAMKNSGFQIPPCHITVNLAPADRRKDGTAFDLPIAVGLLKDMELLTEEAVRDTLFLGELGLNGEIKRVKGVLPIVREAAGKGITRVIVPRENACGVDICYPSQNRKLYEELIQKGGLLSTYAPGTKALPAYFPPRNRIVSGLADALIVIEARQKSGTLITVDMALEQGKDVYVVPGRITDRLSDGCNRLLTQGAGVFLSPESFTEEFLRNWEEKQELSSPDPEQKIRGRRKSRKRIEKLEEPLRQVYKLLDCVPKSTEIILQEAWKKGEYIDIVTLHRRLMELELMGYVKQNTPGHFGTSAN